MGEKTHPQQGGPWLQLDAALEQVTMAAHTIAESAARDAVKVDNETPTELLDRIMTVVKVEALQQMLAVVDGWAENLQTFTPNDVRNMVDDAAREVGVYGLLPRTKT